MSRSGRVVFVALLIIAFVLVTIATGRDKSTPVAVATGPRIDGGGTLASWYCAEGTSSPDGRADEEIVMGNVGAAPSRATITVFGGSEVAPVRREYDIAPGRVVRVRVADIAVQAEPGVLVEVRGGATAVEHRIQRGSDVALGPCAREPADQANFASGTTLRGAEVWLALFNPFPDDAVVDAAVTTGEGLRAPGALQGIVVPRFTRVSVPLHDLVPRADLLAVSTSVRRGRVVAEQSVALDGTDGRGGLALSLGAATAREWRFPAGITGSGRTERLVLANSGSRDVRVTVGFVLDAAAAVEPVAVIIPGATALAVDLSRVPPDIGFATVVRARRPIAAEMIGASTPPQGADVRGLASDLGVTRGARRWAIVPARLTATSLDALALVSADGRRHRVQIVRQVRGRARVLARAVVPAVGRTTIDLARLVGSPDVAVEVRAHGPVAVERVSSRPGFTRSHAVVHAGTGR